MTVAKAFWQRCFRIADRNWVWELKIEGSLAICTDVIIFIRAFAVSVISAYETTPGVFLFVTLVHFKVADDSSLYSVLRFLFFRTDSMLFTWLPRRVTLTSSPNCCQGERTSTERPKWVSLNRFIRFLRPRPTEERVNPLAFVELLLCWRQLWNFKSPK